MHPASVRSLERLLACFKAGKLAGVANPLSLTTNILSHNRRILSRGFMSFSLVVLRALIRRAGRQKLDSGNRL